MIDFMVVPIVTVLLLNNATKKMIAQIVIFFHKNIYKDITIFNLLAWLMFAMVDVIFNRVTYFSTNSTYTTLDV